MISVPLLIVLICNFMAIGILPLLFFRRDRHCILYCVAMGAPYLVALAALLLSFFGYIASPPQAYGTRFLVAQAMAVFLGIASIALIALTAGVHRVPITHRQQVDDAATEVLTWGPYKRIRYPFHTGCLLAIMAAVLALPHPLTLGCLFYSFITLSVNAGHTERRLAASAYGHEYRQYLLHSGRFFPKLMS